MSVSRKYHKGYDDHSFPEFTFEREEDLAHKKRVRKMLEEKLERKRLRDNIGELDGDFDWDELDR